MPTLRSTRLHSLSGLALLTATPSAAAPAPSASVADPISARTEGIGPYQRVVLRNVTIVNGTGAPAQGPYDLVLSGDRIAEIKPSGARSEEHTPELQSLIRISYAVSSSKP